MSISLQASLARGEASLESDDLHATRSTAAKQRPAGEGSVARVTLASINFDGGQAFGSKEQRDNSLGTFGLQGDVLLGSRHLAVGPFLRWGMGGLYSERANNSGLLRFGPRLRLSTRVDVKWPSVHALLSTGVGLAYAQELKREPTTLDPNYRRRQWGTANWNVFAAPGVGLLFPLGGSEAVPHVWNLQVSVSYYFTYWLQEASRNAPLSNRWLEFALGFAGVWMQ